MPKKKLTKKQKEEEKKRIEEERKKQEEEDRIRREEEEKQRLEDERVRKELEEKLRQEELERLGEEAADVKRRSERIESLTTDSDERKQEDDDWKKYLKCEYLPDPAFETELTTHLRIWEETPETSLKECISNCKIAEQVNLKILEHYYDALSEFQQERVEWCEYYINTYKKMCRVKFNEVTKYVMDHIEILAYDKENEIYKNKNANQNKKGDNINLAALINDANECYKIGIFGNPLKLQSSNSRVEFSKVGVQLDLPRTFLSLNNVLRVTWVSSDDMCSKFSPYMSVGGVFTPECFYFPELPKKHKSWLMRNIKDMDETLRKHHYPEPGTNLNNVEPVFLEFTIPQYVYIDETKDDIQVGWWDNEKQEWDLEGLKDVKINKTTHKISFESIRYSPFAYLQSRCTDYPYESWKLRCIAPDVALLDIQTKRINLTFEIGADYAKLVERTEPEFKHFADLKLPPGIVLNELSKCGIHLLPDDRDFELAEIEPKDRGAEERAIWDVVCCINALAFRSAKWNKNPKLKENVVIKIRENLEYDREFFEDYPPDWSYVMWWLNKCSFVDCTDQKEDFSEEAKIKDGHETHALLHLALPANKTSEEAVERCNTFEHIRFMQTLKKTLRLLRLFAFG